MATLNAILDGLEARLSTIEGLRTWEYPSDSLQVPGAVVSLPTSINFDEAFRGDAVRIDVPVHLFVSRANERGARTLLCSFLDASGPQSIRGAIDGDPTLGGKVDWSRVREVTNVGFSTIGGTQYMSCQLIVEIEAQ